MRTGKRPAQVTPTLHPGIQNRDAKLNSPPTAGFGSQACVKGFEFMADFIFNSQGKAHGFRLSSCLYSLEGEPVGRVWAERVYRFDGTYVGALFRNMVVDKPMVTTRGLPPTAPPPWVKPLPGAESRRAIELPYQDVFYLLKASPSEEARDLHSNDELGRQ